MGASDARRLKVLKVENNKLKKLLAKRALAIEVKKESLRKKEWVHMPGASRSSSLAVEDFHTGAPLKVARSGLRDESKRRRNGMCPFRRTCASSRRSTPRYGHGRIRIYLVREGHFMSADRAHRLWPAAGLHLARRSGSFTVLVGRRTRLICCLENLG